MDPRLANIELDVLRHVMERRLAGFIAVLTLVMFILSTTRLTEDAPGSPWPMLMVLGTYMITYTVLYVGLRTTEPTPLSAWVSTTLEVSVATLVVTLQMPAGVEFALKDTPVLLYALATFAAVARLRPTLALYAGMVAATQWLTIYASASQRYVITDPSLGVAMAWQRFGLLILVGVLAEGISWALLDLVDRLDRVQAERNRLRRAFGAYVAEPVVDRVLRGDEHDLHVQTERREATILFLDIRNFTRTTSGQPADLVLHRLNLALDRFSRQVHRKRGIVNKFLGDGMLALFGVPMQDPRHTIHAFEAARALLVEADRLRLSGEYPDLQIGIGLAMGEVLVGDVGGAAQREYTAIGETVNLAARLEQRTKELGVPLLMDVRVARALGPNAPIRALDPIRVRGVPGLVPVFTIDAPEAVALSEAEASGAWTGRWDVPDEVRRRGGPPGRRVG